MSKLLEYMQNANHPADVYIEKASDDSSADDSSSSEGSGFLSGLRNFLEHPFQGSGTVIAPNYTPRPLDDSVYSDIPGTPVASGQFGDIEDESVRDERMKDSADYMAANWPRLYGGVVAADEGLANVVGGIQNAVGGGNGILTNVQRAEEGMQNYRDQWNNEYGDSYFLNPNKFATDAGSGIGSTVPIMALSALMPGAAVAGGTRALTSALSRAGLGRLAMSKAGQALIADTVRSPISSLADSLSEYGTVVNDMMQNGMSEDEARRRAIPMFFKNMALDTFTVPLELGVMKGGKGIATSLLGRSTGEGIAKSIAKGAARTGMLAGASGLTEGYQEGAQNALENDVEGNRDGGWYNPFTWTNEDWEAARGGFVGGALMGVPGNVAAGFHPEARQAPLSAESQEQAQSIKDTLSHGKPAGMSNAAYNAYIELANSGNPDLIKQAASSLESFQQSQEGSQESADDAATEAYKDYETYDQKQEIENFLDNNTVEQIGGEKNFNWLMGVLRNGTPEEVQHAYDTVIATEKATAEQEAKNRPARSGGSMSPNTGNAMANIVIQAANDSGVEPRLGLAIAARESGGDDVNAISMPEPHDGIYGIMQAQEETVSELGLDSQYPDWKTDPYQNAMVGMAILKSKIANENGDVWAGVRDYNGAGEEAEQYRQLVKNNYDNMGDIGGGGGSATYDGLQLTLPDSDEFTDQSGNVSGLTEDTRMKLRVLDNLCYQKFGQHLIVSSSYREGDPNNHGAGVAFDVSGGIVDDPDARQWLEQAGPAVGLFVIPEYQGEAGAEFAHGDNVHFSNVEPGIYGQTRNAEGHWSEEHAAPSIQSILKGGASSGVSSKVAGDNGQFERELDQAAQEAKSDMDKIQAQSDQAMNEIMNDDSAEKTAQDAQQDAENAQKQAEDSQQSAQDNVVPDVAQTIRDTSNDIDEINTLDGMFTKDSNGNDKFIDTPENRDFIKTNYKDEIAKAVNDAMSKKKAPSATPVPKTQQQTPHARLGRILSTYDRKNPKFKEYMNTFRNGTEQEQKKLADDLQTTQELERANSLKGNPLTTQQDQNTPQNAPQRAVESPKQPEQASTPVQAKESLETQKKRKIYLAKKQKLMERVPAGKTVKVHASTNDAGFDATYKIVPAGDITASHDMNYAVNDLYPAEYQPRDRNRPQMRGQVEKMTKVMKPELLAESQFVNEGAPVVNNSGVVLNGNGRVMAVQKAYKGLTDAHKKSAKAYKDYLVSIAPSLGIAPEKVQSMDHPVLVRQAADDADTSAIINSTEGGAKLGGAEQAKADADRLKLSTLEQFVDNGTGEFMNLSNREFRRAAASDVFSDAEGNSVFNEKGDLSPTGAFRIRNAIFAKAYNDNYLLTQLSEATDNNSKNIMNAMIAAAPEVAKVNEGIKNGTLYPDYDISDVITKTAKTIMSLRNEGKPLSFHLQETDLFSQGESEAERLVLEFIERNKFKSRTIADMYKGACDRIFSVGSPKQSKLFDSKEAPRISLENIISNAIQEVEHGQSLFDTTEEKPAEKAVSEVPDNRQAEPAGSGRVHQQEAGRVQSQEKEGNEVDEKSKQSDHVDTEPQQTESKDTEGTHAEEGSQGDVQEEISKFHNVLNDEKSTPKQVIDAYKSVVDKAIANANRSRKNAKMGDKIVTDEYQYLTNSKHWDTFMNEDGGRYWHEVATINADAHKTLRTIVKTTEKEATPKAEQPKETKPTEQPKEKPAGGFTDDEIKTLTDRGFTRWTKKLPNGKVIDRLYINPEYLGLELTRYKSGNISSAKFNGETISNSEARRIEGTKCYVDVATKEVVCDRDDLKQAAQEVVDDALSKEKSQVLAQTETKKAVPKDDVAVTGDEFGKYKNLKELRAKAKAYYKEHLQGTSVHNPILGDVELKDDSIDFTGKGISKAVSTSAKENKLLLIKYLPQLIENANEVASQPNVKDKREAKQYTYLMTHAIVGGKQENVIVTIFTDANGNKYYNHILNDEENKKRPPVYPAQAANKSDGIPAMREPFSTSIIPQKAEKWNKPDELRNQLSDAPKVDTKYSVREANDQLTRSKEDLKAEIKEAFPTAKEIKDEGDRMTFTMSNGSHIVVDVNNEILLTDEELAQAKKDHHIDDNGNVVVEGYAQLHGKDAYMALSQGSRENTGFHEAYHLAEGAVLTDREKAAIKKAIPDAEKRADKYAEWVEARKHGRGTAWGKLFQKIKDFAAKMRKIFTGVETVNDIFRQIESGKVWERGANNSNQRGSYSVYAKRKLKEDMQAFAKKIDDFMNHKLSSNEYVRVMDTPLVLNLIGEKMLPVYISTRVLDKVLHWKHGLEISPEVLKEIPRRIADPIFILKAIDNKGVEDISSKIVVVDLKDNNGATIMVPFVMEQKTRDRNKITGNIIKSVYGKAIGKANSHPNDTWYINRLMRGDCIYINKKRTDHWLTGINTSARTPNGPLVVDSFNLSNIIADETDLGKLKKDNPTHYSIREQNQKINTDAKKRFMNHIEVAQKQADENAIGVHRTLLQSPSRIAEKKKYFKPFFKMADDAMNLLTKLRADYQRHLDSALDLSKKDKATLQELLWSGDMEGKEYTREELREQGYNEQVIDSYWKIRNLFRKAYNQLNETRKQAKTKTGHFAGRKLDELRHNKFVEILRETDQDDGSTLVSYKEYGNWQAHYLVNEDELKTLENDDNIQILEKVPTKEGPMDGQKHWKVTTREGVPDIHDRKGYVPHFFHEYMVRFVDSHGKATVISSGRTIREATKNAIKWQAENEEILKKRNEGDWKITIAPKVFDFGEIGLDESQYATTVGDKDFYLMEKKIADKHSLTLHEAKEMLDGMVKKKGRHRFFGNFLRRTGADGYEQEIEWVLRHYFNSTSRYVAMESKFKPQAISLFERLFGRFDNEYHGLPNYIKEYINDINGNPSTLEKQLNDLLNAIPAIGKWVNAHIGDRAAVSLANSITNKISIAKLGFLNVSSAMLNILQIANAAAYTGNISTLWKALLKGAHRKYSLHDLKILRETNVLNDIGLDSGAGYGKFSAGKWANRGMILFKESEGIVRRGVTLAAYEAGRKRGMSHEEAIRYAKDVNRKSNFDYGVHDAPGIFRRGSIFSQIFLQFKKYPIKQLEAMKDFLPFFGKGTTKKQKAIFWGTYFAMAGLFQIPFANILGLLIMGITGDDPEKEAKKSLIELAENYPSLKPLAKIGMYGIGTFANIDITSRVGIGDAVPDDLQSLFGPAASTLFNVAKSAYGGDNWTKQVRNVSPGLGNLLMAAQGNSVGKRGRVNQEYTTPYQRLLRGMGFQSTDESDSYLIQSILSSEKKKASSKKQQLIDEYIANPTGENARKLKNAGIKPSTVKAEQKKKKLDTKGRTESTMNKKDKKQYQYLLDW
nr:MAG TPA: PLxRFG domain protein [Caudoviricetes sp.]